jgi:hypothetical protein
VASFVAAQMVFVTIWQEKVKVEDINNLKLYCGNSIPSSKLYFSFIFQ